MTPLKRKIIFQTPILGFHVSFRGCIWLLTLRPMVSLIAPVRRPSPIANDCWCGVLFGLSPPGLPVANEGLGWDSLLSPSISGT